MSKRSTLKTDAAIVMPILSPILGEQLAADIIEHRDTLREPMTRKAAELQVKEYLACGDPTAAAEMQILRGWRAIKSAWFFNELRKDENQSNKRRTIADAAATFNTRYGDINAAFGLPSIERH